MRGSRVIVIITFVAAVFGMTTVFAAGHHPSATAAGVHSTQSITRPGPNPGFAAASPAGSATTSTVASRTRPAWELVNVAPRGIITTAVPTTLAAITVPPPPPATIKPVAKPKPAPAPAPTPAVSVAADCIARTNVERANAGLAPVKLDSRVQAAAQGHSNYQASISTMTHTGAGGSTAGTRITAQGYTWKAYGENVAAGQGSCASVMAAWMASPHHRDNILNPAYVDIGVAAAKNAAGVIYWTMDLAAKP